MGDPAVRHKELETTTHNDKDKGPGERETSKGCSGLSGRPPPLPPPLVTGFLRFSRR